MLQCTMEEVEEMTISITCDLCLSCGFSEGGDGFFYCDCCGYQDPDFMDTGIADEHFVDRGSDSCSLMYLPSNSPQRPEEVSDEETSSQYKSLSQSGSSLSPDRDTNTPEEEDDHDDTSACSNIPRGDD